MRLVSQFVAISLFVLSSVGCDSFKGLEADLNAKADVTLSFWARLQGIQWHGNKEISSLNDANAVAVSAFDVDGVARGFSKLSEKHSQLATQLTALDAINTYETAIDYRDRLVATHQALGEKYKTHATATESRDMQRITLERPGLKSLLTEYAALCNEKNSVMATLKQRYDCEFDVAE